MVLYNGGANKHEPTPELRQRVCDLVMAGTPIHIICEIIGINDDTLRNRSSVSYLVLTLILPV